VERIKRTVIVSKAKKDWSKEAHALAWVRLQEKMRNPKFPSSYWRKQELLDNITDDFPRY
jgi:hypothetical protein